MKQALITCLLLLGLSNALIAQDFLDKKIEFQVDQVPRTLALKKLSDQTGIDIAFSRNYFKNAPPITIDEENATIRQVLEKILNETDMDYKTLGENRVLLFKVQLNRYQLTGYIKDRETGEALVGARIISKEENHGTLTNEYGFFSLKLPQGTHSFLVRSVGYKKLDTTFTLKQERRVNLPLKPMDDLPVVEISEVTEETMVHPVQVNRDNMTTLSPILLKRIPTLNGQGDFLRISQMLPGISSSNDGFGGLNIRGGEAGQNLLYIDGSPVYIPYHLLGLYTAYNPATVKTVQVAKGNFPARYGGAVSSIMDVRIREGNREEWSGSGQVDLLTAGALLEGPIGKKGSILMAGRFSPFAYFFEPAISRLYFGNRVDFFGATFHDYNLKINLEPTDRDHLFLNVFSGYDQMDQNDRSQENGGAITTYSEFLLRWQNTVGSMRWNHLFSEKLFMNASAHLSAYQQQFSARNEFIQSAPDTYVRDQFIIDNRSNNLETGLRLDFNYALTARNNLRFGGQFLYRQLAPQFYAQYEILFDSDYEDELGQGYDFSFFYETEDFPTYYINESALYVEDHIQLNHWYFNLGIRLSQFQSLRALNGEETSVNYIQPEPRLLAKYRINEKMNISTTLNRRTQYLHLIANPGIQLPNNLWLPATNNRKPQIMYEGEIDYRYQIHPKIKVGATAFYRHTENLYAFGDSVEFFVPSESFTSFSYLTEGIGVARGLEFLADYADQKRGALLSYTLSKTERQFDAINLGKPFPAIFDSRHQVNFTFHQKLTPQFSLGLNWVYASKRPKLNIYQIISSGSLAEVSEDAPGSKNSTRLDDYNRIDLNLRYEIKAKKTQHLLKIGVYNLLNTRNVAFHAFQYKSPTSGEVTASPLTSLPIMPSFSYRISF